MPDTKCKLSGAAITVAVILGLITIILVFSFANLEYYEYGFKRRRTTGSVDVSHVYSGGRHLVGPDVEFKTFKADMHFVAMSGVSVYTANKLEVWLTLSFQYFLRQEDLPFLHDEFDIHYAPILKRNAQDALKGAATVFGTWDFITDRRRVERGLFQAVKDRLGGICCEKGCLGKKTCKLGCKPYKTCKQADKGLFADVRYFQLQDVYITNQVKGRHLAVIVEKEVAVKAEFLQKAEVVTKQTDALVKDIHNEAGEISQNANAHSRLMVTVAKANATSIIEQARSEGLHSLYTRLGISSTEHKATFDYLRTLKDLDSAYLSVDFSQLILGPVTPNRN